MTDEQVEKIVQALEGNSGESLLTVVVAIVSVVLGFGLSQIAEWLSRRRSQAATKRARQNALAIDAAAVTYKMGSYNARRLRDTDTVGPVAEVAARFQGGGVDSREVGFWWTARIGELVRPPAEGRDFTDDENAKRAEIGADVMWRLIQWENGRIRGTEIASDQDPPRPMKRRRSSQRG